MVVFNVLSCITQYNFQLFWEQVQKFLAHPQHFFTSYTMNWRVFFFFLQAQKILLERRALTLVVKKTNQFKPRKRLYKTLLRKRQGWISLSSKKNSLTTSTSIFATKKKKSVERKSRKGGWENGEYSWTWENRTQTVEQYSTNLAVESKPRTDSTESGKRRCRCRCWGRHRLLGLVKCTQATGAGYYTFSKNSGAGAGYIQKQPTVLWWRYRAQNRQSLLKKP